MYERYREKFDATRPPEVEIAPESIHIWRWFWELRQTAFIPSLGQTALSYAELGTWAELTGVTLEPAVVKIIRAMDEAYLSAIQREQSKRKSSGKQ